MLGTVISSLMTKVTSFLDLCRVVVSQMMTLYRTIIAVGTDRMTLIAQYIKSQCVALKLSIKPCHAQLTNQALLIKVGLMNVLHSLGQVGQQLLTTVRQILQRVLNLLKRGN
jgi:phage-related protein